MDEPIILEAPPIVVINDVPAVGVELTHAVSFVLHNGGTVRENTSCAVH